MQKNEKRKNIDINPINIVPASDMQGLKHQLSQLRNDLELRLKAEAKLQVNIEINNKVDK